MDYLHPFGIAAGMDKRAEALRGWESIGVAFSEIGGVTMVEQTAIPNLECFVMGRSSTCQPNGFQQFGSEKVALQLNVQAHNQYLFGQTS